MQKLTLEQLRTYAVARSLFTPTTLLKAIAKLGFVQADPIRAPARAQDLTLRHRVMGYRAGDLESRYAQLPIEEDFFVNYGFLPRTTQQLMHPRTAQTITGTLITSANPFEDRHRREGKSVASGGKSFSPGGPGTVDPRGRNGSSRNGTSGRIKQFVPFPSERYARSRRPEAFRPSFAPESV